MSYPAWWIVVHLCRFRFWVFRGIGLFLSNFRLLNLKKNLRFGFSTRKTEAIAILSVLTLIWGSSFILIKRGLVHLTFWQLGSLRIVFAGLILMPVLWLERERIVLKDLPAAAVSGLLGNLLPSFLFGLAITGVSSSVAGLLNTLTPLWVLVTGTLFYGMSFKRTQGFGIALGLMGAALLTLIGKTGDWGRFNAFGLYAVLGTICYGLNVNYIKQRLGQIRPLLLASMALGIVFWPALLMFLFTDWQVVFQGSALDSVGAVFVLAFFSTAVGLVLFNRLIQIASPVLASAVTYLMPVVSVFWGIMDGEPFMLLHVIGMSLVFGGIWLIARGR